MKYIAIMVTKTKKTKENLKGSGLFFKNKPYSWQVDNSRIYSKKSGNKCFLFLLGCWIVCEFCEKKIIRYSCHFFGFGVLLGCTIGMV